MTGRRRKAQRAFHTEKPLASSGPRPPRRAARHRWLLALALLVAGAFLVRREVAARAREPVAPADAARLDPDVRAVIEEHLRRARTDPSALNHGTLGLAYEANGMWGEAERCYDVALELAPLDALWKLHKGIAASEQGDSDAALALFETVVREREDLAAARFRLADALQRAGRIGPALEHYRAAARLADDRTEAHTGLGAALLEHGDLEAARASLARAVALDPDHRSAHYQLGLVHRALGDKVAAARELALGVDAQKRYLPDPLEERLKALRVGYSTRIQGAVDLVRGGRTEAGIAILEQVLALHPADTNVLNNLAAAHLDAGAPERALPLLERARSLSEDEFATWINLASWALASQRFEEALAFADRAVALAGSVSSAHAARGKALLRLRRQDEAYRELARAVELEARDPKLQMLLGVLCIDLERYEEARTCLTTAVSLAPDWLEPHLKLCRLQASLGEFDHARETLVAARRIAPTDPTVVELDRRLALAPAGQ